MERDWTAVRGGEILVAQQSVDEIHRLREENARLKAEIEVYRKNAVAYQEYDKAKRERDEAREKLALLEVDYAEAQDIAVSESAGRRAAESEVARLEGLILDTQDGPIFETMMALDNEAKRIRAAKGE